MVILVVVGSGGSGGCGDGDHNSYDDGGDGKYNCDYSDIIKCGDGSDYDDDDVQGECDGDGDDKDDEEEEWDSGTARRSDGVHLQNRISLLNADAHTLALERGIVVKLYVALYCATEML